MNSVLILMMEMCILYYMYVCTCRRRLVLLPRRQAMPRYARLCAAMSGTPGSGPHQEDSPPTGDTGQKSPGPPESEAQDTWTEADISDLHPDSLTVFQMAARAFFRCLLQSERSLLLFLNAVMGSEHPVRMSRVTATVWNFCPAGQAAPELCAVITVGASAFLFFVAEKPDVEILSTIWKACHSKELLSILGDVGKTATPLPILLLMGRKGGAARKEIVNVSEDGRRLNKAGLPVQLFRVFSGKEKERSAYEYSLIQPLRILELQWQLGKASKRSPVEQIKLLVQKIGTCLGKAAQNGYINNASMDEYYTETLELLLFLQEDLKLEGLLDISPDRLEKLVSSVFLEIEYDYPGSLSETNPRNEKDNALKALFDHNTIFAEVFSVLGLKSPGEIDPEKLEKVSPTRLLNVPGGFRMLEMDSVRVLHGKFGRICELGLGFQTGISDVISMRKVTYNAGCYMNQLIRNERASTVKERFMAIGKVLYFGERPWAGSSLRDEIADTYNQCSEILQREFDNARNPVIDLLRQPDELINQLRYDFWFVIMCLKKKPVEEWDVGDRKILYPVETIRVMQSLTDDEDYIRSLKKVEEAFGSQKGGEKMEATNLLDYFRYEGSKVGRLAEKKDTVFRMFKLDLYPQIIAKSVDLPVDTVTEMIAEFSAKGDGMAAAMP